MKKKWILRHCDLDLDLWLKVTNIKTVSASAETSAISNHLTKTASKSVPLFGWNFVHWQTDSLTHSHTHAQKNCNENIIPQRFREGVKISCLTFNELWPWQCYLEVQMPAKIDFVLGRPLIKSKFAESLPYTCYSQWSVHLYGLASYCSSYQCLTAYEPFDNSSL